MLIIFYPGVWMMEMGREHLVSQVENSYLNLYVWENGVHRKWYEMRWNNW